MKKVIYLILFAFISGFGLDLEAQPLRLQVKANGDSTPVLVSSEDYAAGKSIEIYAVSNDNDSLPVSFTLSGPAGLRAKVSTAPMARSAEATLGSEKLFQDLPTETPLVIRKPKTGAMVLGAESCNIPESVVIQLTSIFTIVFGHAPTREELCALFGGGGIKFPDGPGGGGPPTGPGGGSFEGDGFVRSYGILHKNTCDNRVKKYLVRMTIDITGVSPEIGAQGFDLSASIDGFEFGGRKACSIKSAGEGKYKGPLLLMSSIGSYGGGEKIELYSWRKNRGRRVAKIPVKDYVYYRGLVLTRSTIGSVLRGGKGVFEISNGSSMYSVCFSLTATRQRVNGYPG